jgi:acetylornithine deacetylase/succinyl-diaminopimelate desuccinylase-like protein
VSTELARELAERPAELLRRLIRFDTSNPPGHDRECVEFVAELLRAGGLEVEVAGASAERPNAVARLRGEGRAPPLLLQGHLDVVPAAERAWEHPPFDAEVADGFVWGRGALDMKGGVAMMVAATLRLAASGERPPGDVIVAALADEEAGSDEGAAWLVEHRPELFDGVRYALGEFGGFSMHAFGRRFYPIQVAEKKICWVRATFEGSAGHGSLPPTDSALGKLGRALARLEARDLPMHVTPVVERMVEAIAAELPRPAGALLRRAIRPPAGVAALKALGKQGERVRPLFHNTANPSVLKGGEKVNVVPEQASVTLDGRLLPGFGPDDLLRELTELFPDPAEFEVLRYDGGADDADLSLYPTLAAALRELDPDGTPIPFLMPASSDARFFARLGIQTYGYIPMRLPADFDFNRFIHAPNERIPVDALDFGTECVGRVLRRFDGGTKT